MFDLKRIKSKEEARVIKNNIHELWKFAEKQIDIEDDKGNEEEVDRLENIIKELIKLDGEINILITSLYRKE